MNENDKQVSGVEATANPAPSQGRRRLVKGAIFAVPAIVTLRTSFASQNSGPSIEKALASFSCDTEGHPNLTNPALLSFIASGGEITDPPFTCTSSTETVPTQKKKRKW